MKRIMEKRKTEYEENERQKRGGGGREDRRKEKWINKIKNERGKEEKKYERT